MNKLYPWLYPHFKKLVTSYQNGYNHHALLIHGVSGIGISVLIYAINCFLMCCQPDKYIRCKRCRGCQLMTAQTHPDYYIIAPTENNSTIGIDIIREINRKIQERSRLSGVKIIWLQNIVQFTKAAMSALLKVLEEPPEKTWFFISCYELSRLPITLRSRCCLYYLHIPEENLSLKWLAHKVAIPINKQLSALRLCHGAPLAALSYLQSEIWLQRDQLCNILLNSLKYNDWFSLLEILNQKQVMQKLSWMASLLLDAMRIQQGATLFSNVDVWPLLSTLANKLSGFVIQNIFYYICKARKHLLLVSGINQELILTDLLLHIERLLQLK